MGDYASDLSYDRKGVWRFGWLAVLPDVALVAMQSWRKLNVDVTYCLNMMVSNLPSLICIAPLELKPFPAITSVWPQASGV